MLVVRSWNMRTGLLQRSRGWPSRPAALTDFDRSLAIFIRGPAPASDLARGAHAAAAPGSWPNHCAQGSLGRGRRRWGDHRGLQLWFNKQQQLWLNNSSSGRKERLRQRGSQGVSCRPNEWCVGDQRGARAEVTRLSLIVVPGISKASEAIAPGGRQQARGRVSRGRGDGNEWRWAALLRVGVGSHKDGESPQEVVCDGGNLPLRDDSDKHNNSRGVINGCVKGVPAGVGKSGLRGREGECLV